MTAKTLASRDAIQWHSDIASAFDSKYRGSPAFQERYALWTGLIDRFSARGDVVLDLGCGSGIFATYAAKRTAQVIALDGSDQMLVLATRKAEHERADNIRFVHSTLEEAPSLGLPLVDLLLCSSVLEYSGQLGHDLAFISSSLRRGGVLLVSMPNGQSLYRTLERWTYRLFGFPKYYGCVKTVTTEAAFKGMLAHHSLEVLDTHFYGAIGWFGRAMRMLGLTRYGDSLVVFACRKVESPPVPTPG
ncbi:MAG: class I SAM-dependent methyltransferase [Betaproteobacteria bacterium]|nr:class I SAM-dependent methyltransferase [Betaproteobacteria bacterium]